MSGERFGLGLLPSPEGPHYQLADYVPRAEIPEVIDYFPQSTPVRTQMQTSECAGFATTKALEWHNQGEYPSFLSPQWAYKLGKDRDGYPNGAGTSFWAILQGLRHEGVCPEEDWPFENRWPPAQAPAPEAAAHARQFMIESYAQVGRTQIHQSLYTFGPGMLGVKVYDSFYTTGKDGIVPKASGNLHGGHGIDLRYSDLSDRLFVGGVCGGWNSWNVGWGKKGAWFIPYAHLPSLFMEAWTIIDVKLIPRRWPDLKDIYMSDDDLASMDKVWQRGLMVGYPDGTFRPGDYVTHRQVGTVLHRAGLITTDEWTDRYSGDYSEAKRGWVRDQFPQLTWNKEEWNEKLTRYQLMMLAGRWLRGV